MANHKPLYVFAFGTEPHPSIVVDMIEAADPHGLGMSFDCERHGINKGFLDSALLEGKQTAECPFCSIADARIERFISNPDRLRITPTDAGLVIEAGGRMLELEESIKVDEAELAHLQLLRHMTLAELERKLEELVADNEAGKTKTAELEQTFAELAAENDRLRTMLIAGESLGEQCEYQEASGERCPNPPTVLLIEETGMRCAVCAEHAESSDMLAIEIGGVQVGHG